MTMTLMTKFTANTQVQDQKLPFYQTLLPSFISYYHLALQELFGGERKSQQKKIPMERICLRWISICQEVTDTYSVTCMQRDMQNLVMKLQWTAADSIIILSGVFCSMSIMCNHLHLLVQLLRSIENIVHCYIQIICIN